MSTGCSIINSPSFLNTGSQDSFATLPLTVQYLCDLRDAMSRQWSPSTSQPTLPKEAEDFPRGVKYPKDMPLPTTFLFVVKRLANKQFKTVNLL